MVEAGKTGILRRRFLVATGAAGGLMGVQALAAPAVPARLRPSAIADAAKLAVNNIAASGLDDVFPRPFEADALRACDDLRRDAVQRICESLDELVFRSSDFSALELVDVPKRSGSGLRACALIEPADTAVYLTLALLAAPAIEADRLPAKEGVVHSYRYSSRIASGQIFDRKYGYKSFMFESSRRAARSAFVVNCDIADFYGSIELERLGRDLEQLAVQPRVVSYAVALLEFWSSGGRRGLPVGQQASRIFAEAVLSRADKELSKAGVPFVRFVDDFRLFAEDEQGARKSLAAVADILATAGLVQNPDKTRLVAARAGGPSVRIPSPPSPYSTRLMPLQFRRPNRRQFAAMQTPIDEREFTACLNGEPQSLGTLRRLTRHAIYGRHDKFVRAIPDLVARHPTFTGYAVLALLRGRDFVAAKTRRSIGERLAHALFDAHTPQFGKIFILDLLGDPRFAERETVATYARQLATSPRGLCFRQALEALRKTGGIPADLYDCYGTADAWARRSFRASLDPNLPPRLWDESVTENL